MRIGLVGGIFDKPASYRAKHSISPETILADGLRERGWEVIVRGHHQPLPLEEVDLVHVHHFGRAALRMAVYPQRPAFVFTSHDPFAMNGLPVGWRRRLTDGLVLSRADAVVALSAAERDFLVRHYGVARARITVIPNGINTQIFDRVEGQGGEELLFVGQLEAFKGLDYLLEALPAVRERFPQLKLRAVYHTAALLERYRQETARLGIRECVEFAGSKTAPELAELYSTAAIVVAPSLGEALSTVVLEAMCCGAAVLATDVGGIREQLDETTGVIVPPRDSSALSEAICRLLGDGRLRRNLGNAARHKARAQFSIRKMIERHEGLYEQVLGADAEAA